MIRTEIIIKTKADIKKIMGIRYTQTTDYKPEKRRAERYQLMSRLKS